MKSTYFKIRLFNDYLRISFEVFKLNLQIIICKKTVRLIEGAFGITQWSGAFLLLEYHF